MSVSCGASIRGCGKRVVGGVYAECPLDPGGGLPWYEFLQEPPIPVTDLAMRVSPVGVTLIERDGITHVIDWVGSAHYPNVTDFVEEFKRMGISRRLPETLDFSRLTSQSRLILVHARAVLGRWQLLAKDPANLMECPVRRQIEHPKGQCVGTWWHDLDAAGTREWNPFTKRRVNRDMPGGWSYAGRLTLPGVERSPGIFASVPIARIAVVADPDGGRHVKNHERAAAARLPVVIEEE